MAGPAAAQDSFPSFSAEFSVELETDYTFSSTDPAAELADTYATIGADLSLAFTAATSLNAGFVFEPVLDPAGDRFFEDHGLYLEQLFLAHEFEGVTLMLGKFNPAFGAAPDAPGIYGADFAEDYELTERIGAAIAVPFEAFGGEHAVNFAVFMADTTFLSDSIFQDRGRTREIDGGVSNTQSPESFALWTESVYGDTGVNFGLQYQSRGQGDLYDQSGVLVGLTQGFGEDMPVLLAEVGYFPHFDGAEESALYGTIGIEAPVGPVTLSGVYAIRDVEATDTDHLVTATAEYGIFENVTAGIGYRFGHEAGENSHTLGVLLAYEFGVGLE